MLLVWVYPSTVTFPLISSAKFGVAGLLGILQLRITCSFCEDVFLIDFKTEGASSAFNTIFVRKVAKVDSRHRTLAVAASRYGHQPVVVIYRSSIEWAVVTTI